MAKYNKKVTKKKTLKKKRVMRKKAVIPRTMVSLGAGFPKKIQATHTYAKNLTLSSTLGVPTTYTFSCNGMYDPDNTAILGNQPMFFDQLSAIYQHYCVIGSKVTLKIIPAYANQPAFGFAVYLNDDVTVSPTSLEGIREQTSGSIVYIPGGSDVMRTITKNWSASKTFGKAVLANTDLQGTITTNPNEQTHYSFFVQPLDFATSLTVYVQVTIQYIAVWKEMRDIERS